jgi:hypothetical protein
MKDTLRQAQERSKLSAAGMRYESPTEKRLDLAALLDGPAVIPVTVT